MRRFAVSFLGLAIFAYAADASACSCMKMTPSEGLTSSYAVFEGEVTDIQKNLATRFGGLEVTLRVKRIWKGERQEEIKVHTAGSSAACGYGFKKGVTYLVYAVRDEADPMRVSLCSRTAPVEKAKEDLDFLGKPTHTLEGGRKGGCSASPVDSDAAHLGYAALLAGLGIAIRRRL